jgi:hypothetical protein
MKLSKRIIAPFAGSSPETQHDDPTVCAVRRRVEPCIGLDADIFRAHSLRRCILRSRTLRYPLTRNRLRHLGCKSCSRIDGPLVAKATSRSYCGTFQPRLRRGKTRQSPRCENVIAGVGHDRHALPPKCTLIVEDDRAPTLNHELQYGRSRPPAWRSSRNVMELHYPVDPLMIE